MARSNQNWLANLAKEMERPAGEVIRELLETRSTQGAANILGISYHTLRAYCERHSIPRVRYRHDPDRKKVESVAINARSHVLEYGGESLTLAQWSRKTGIAQSTLRLRLSRLGWPVERALMTKVVRL